MNSFQLSSSSSTDAILSAACKIYGRLHDENGSSSSTSYSSDRRTPPKPKSTSMSSGDAQYLKQELGRPLRVALAEIAARKPRDPIHYLARWLYKFRLNQVEDRKKRSELVKLFEERQRMAKIAFKKQAETAAKDAVCELLSRVDAVIKGKEVEEDMKRFEEFERMRKELEEEAKDVLGVYYGPTSRVTI